MSSTFVLSAQNSDQNRALAKVSRLGCDSQIHQLHPVCHDSDSAFRILHLSSNKQRRRRICQFSVLCPQPHRTHDIDHAGFVFEVDERDARSCGRTLPVCDCSPYQHTVAVRDVEKSRRRHHAERVELWAEELCRVRVGRYSCRPDIRRRQFDVAHAGQGGSCDRRTDTGQAVGALPRRSARCPQRFSTRDTEAG